MIGTSVPPENAVEHRLWAMGFDAEERAELIELASKMWWTDAIDLGLFISTYRTQACAHLAAGLGVQLAPRPGSMRWWLDQARVLVRRIRGQ